MERIVENPAIKSLSNIPAFFYSKELMPFAGEIYRPLSDTSFAIEYSIWGLNPIGYHTTNIFLHLINSILLFLLLERFFHSERVSFLASLLFAWHPIHTEAVIWIKGREDLFVTMFGLLTLIWYLHSKERGTIFLFLSFFSFILALISKEMALTIPLILVGMDLVGKENVIHGAKRYLPFFVMTLLYLLIRYLVLKQVAQTGYWGGGIMQTLYTMSRVISYYTKLLFFPINLCLDYLGYPVSKSLTSPNVISSILLLLLSSALGIYHLLRYRGIIGFSIMWFFVTLIPVSNIVPLKILLAERFLYLPSIGIAFIYGVIVYGIPWNNWKIHFSIILVTASFALLTLEREMAWSSSSILWADTVRKMPYNDRAHFNLASVFMEEGRFREALEENNAVLRLTPLDPMAYANRGLNYAAMGETEKATSDYEKALLINPRLSNVHHNMGTLYLNTGENMRAVEEFEKELLVNPNEKSVMKLYEACIKAGNDLFERGSLRDALIYYIKAVKTNKYREEAYLNLALTYCKTGNKDAASRVYENLIKLRPDLQRSIQGKINSLK